MCEVDEAREDGDIQTIHRDKMSGHSKVNEKLKRDAWAFQLCYT